MAMARTRSVPHALPRAHHTASDLWTPVWICPSCGRPFARLNQSHSCGRGESVRRHLERKSPHAIALYRRFAELVRRCGPVAIVPSRAGIVFQVRTVFAAIDRLTATTLLAHVVFDRRHDHPRFTKVEVRSPSHQRHHFSARTRDDLDEDVARWLAEAHRLGAVGSKLAASTAPERFAGRR